MRDWYLDLLMFFLFVCGFFFVKLKINYYEDCIGPSLDRLLYLSISLILSLCLSLICLHTLFPSTSQRRARSISVNLIKYAQSTELVEFTACVCVCVGVSVSVYVYVFVCCFYSYKVKINYNSHNF